MNTEDVKSTNSKTSDTLKTVADIRINLELVSHTHLMVNNPIASRVYINTVKRKWMKYKIMTDIKSKCQLNKAPDQVLKFIIYELVRQLEEVQNELDEVEDELSLFYEYWEKQGHVRCDLCGDWIESTGNKCGICKKSLCNDGENGSQRCMAEVRQCYDCKKYYCNKCGEFWYGGPVTYFWTCECCTSKKKNS